jgi:hypothetical protein
MQAAKERFKGSQPSKESNASIHGKYQRQARKALKAGKESLTGRQGKKHNQAGEKRLKGRQE